MSKFGVLSRSRDTGASTARKRNALSMIRHQTNSTPVSGKAIARCKTPSDWQIAAYDIARYRAGLQFLQVWECDLRTMAEPRWDNNYEFRLLDADDVCRLAANPENDLPANAAPRVTDGSHRCFAVFDGPNLACYTWSAERNIDADHTKGIPLSLPAGASYLFKSFAVPAYRGRWIYMLMAQRVSWSFAVSG